MSDFYEDLWLRKNISKLTPCFQYRRKGWFLSVHQESYALVNGVRQILFSLHSEDVPNQCLTGITVTHCRHHNGLHYTLEGGFCSVSPPFVGLELKPCIGGDDQSFFVDLDFFAAIQALRRATGGQVSLPARKPILGEGSSYHYPYPNHPHFRNQGDSVTMPQAGGNLLEIAAHGSECDSPLRKKRIFIHLVQTQDGATVLYKVIISSTLPKGMFALRHATIMAKGGKLYAKLVLRKNGNLADIGWSKIRLSY